MRTLQRDAREMIPVKEVIEKFKQIDITSLDVQKEFYKTVYSLSILCNDLSRY